MTNTNPFLSLSYPFRMRQLNGNLLNKELIDLDPNFNKLISDSEQKKIMENSQKINEKALKKSNQMIKNENRIMNENKLDQLLIKMEKNDENKTTQSIMMNLAGQGQLSLNQLQELQHQQNLLNPQLNLPNINNELSLEQLNQFYYYYYPYYYLYKLNSKI